MAANGGDQSDAVAIPTELSVKHPLQNAWVLWFDNPVKRLGAKDWSSNLKKVPGHPIILLVCTSAREAFTLVSPLSLSTLFRTFSDFGAPWRP